MTRRLPLCAECDERHTDALTCEQVADLLDAERAAGWDASP